MNIYIKKNSTANFEIIQIEDIQFGGGGQGSIHKILSSGYSDYCLKIYKNEQVASVNQARIQFMVSNPPQNIIEKDDFRICWPTHMAYNNQKQFIGYVMPLAFPGSRDLLILSTYNPQPISQQKKYNKYPDWFDKYELTDSKGIINRIKMLHNWALALYFIHKTGQYVLIDIKPENVLATSSGKISVVDTDSFQITDNDKLLFSGSAFTPAYFPPEGKMLSQQKRPFTISCDCFAAAVCFYKILVGVHPYNGTVLKSPYDKCVTEEECISNGLFAFGDKKSYITFNDNFNLHQNFFNLPKSIQELFIRAFSTNASVRPKMDEWCKTFQEAVISKVVIKGTTVKPNAKLMIPITITEVIFSDQDYNGNIIRDFNSILWTDTTYLTPKITYELKSSASNTLEIGRKIISPNGSLCTGTNSPIGLTCIDKIQSQGTGGYSCVLSGWGNQSKTCYDIPGQWRMEFYYGKHLLYKKTFEIKQASTDIPQPKTTRWTPKPIPIGTAQDDKVWKIVKKVLKVVIPIAILASIGWLMKGFLLGNEENNQAKKAYVYVSNLYLRSSKETDNLSNHLATLDYGTELIKLGSEEGWAFVDQNGKQGYVSSDFLLDFNDFHLLNGVWGNDDAQQIISTSQCRLAVLDYLKKNQLQSGTDGWQIYSKPKGMKQNTVLFPRINDGYDYYSDFAFILKNNKTGNRKMVLYSFGANETPIFRYSEDAPTQGDIKSITYNKWNEKYKVSYSNERQISSTNETVKQNQENLNEISSNESFPNMVSILSVDFANVNFVNKILTDYGQQLYSNMEYLRPKIHYKKKLDKEENFKFQIKIIHPDNRLESNRISPTGYTFEQEVKLAEKEGYLELKSWGSSNGDFYKAGSYRYEIWCNDQELHSSIVKIQETKITDKSGKLITTASDYKVYDNAEVMPEFPDGGYEGMKKYLREKVQHSRASKNGQKGHVLVECIIEADGSISNVKASKGVYHALNEDAVRIVMGMPKWKPGKIGNKAVRVKYTIPVSF